MTPSNATIDKVTVRTDNSGVDLDLTLHPSGKKTNARLGFAYEGSGFGLFVLPEIGDEVVVIFTNDDINSGIVVARMPNKFDYVPAGVGHDKILLVGKPGHNLDITINGNVSMVVTGDTSIDTTGNVDVQSGGDSTVTAGGNATVEAAANASVKAGAAADVTAPAVTLGNGAGGEQAMATAAFYNWVLTHTHSGTEPGPGNSGAPTTPPPADSLTSTTKAN